MYLTTGEAARRCGVRVNTIKNWIRRGLLTGVRTPGGHWRIPLHAFERFMTENGMMPAALARPAWRVLLIDDDPAAHELLSGAMETDGCAAYEVHMAHDGYAGLIEIGRLRPDLIVLDIMMPGIHGLEVIHRIKAADSPLPGARIIVVTAAGGRRLVVNRIEQAGPDAVLFKPLDVRAFVHTVHHVLGIPEGGVAEGGLGI